MWHLLQQQQQDSSTDHTHQSPGSADQSVLSPGGASICQRVRDCVQYVAQSSLFMDFPLSYKFGAEPMTVFILEELLFLCQDS